MELIVNEVVLPEQITFNYEELKSGLLATISKYENLVYNEEQIPIAKADVATLRKLAKALNDERIRQEKEYMKPFNVFKEQIKEIISIIDKPVDMISGQIKEYENKKSLDKLNGIEMAFDGTAHPDWLKLVQIFNDKWLNASVTIKKITEEIDERIDKILSDLAVLSNFEEFSFEATEEYKQSLDLNKAIAEGKRLAELQKKKAEEVKNEETASIRPTVSAQEESVSVKKEWLSFKALLSVDDASALKQFFASRNIEFEAII